MIRTRDNAVSFERYDSVGERRALERTRRRIRIGERYKVQGITYTCVGIYKYFALMRTRRGLHECFLWVDLIRSVKA